MLNLLKKRRSIRKYKEKAVEPEKIKEIIQGALLSPSSRGRTPWEFIVVTDNDTLQKLSSSKQGGSAFIKEAPLAIVVLADSEVCDVWIEDASSATTLIQLVAESLELGSCWVQIRERKHNDEVSAEEYVSGILNIPKNLRVEAIVSIGYPDEVKESHQEGNLKYEKVFLNNYSSKYKF